MQHYFSFKLGSFDCAILSEGKMLGNAEHFFVTPDADELQRVLAAHKIEPDGVESWFHPLLLDTGQHKILIDTGIGEDDERTDLAFLKENLAALGVEKAHIDIVIITHAHGDHTGGNTLENGNPAYPNARYYLSRAEWDHWTNPATLAQDNFHVPRVRRQLMAIQDRLELVDGETEIVPGVRLSPAPGHTPGHSVVWISSGSEHLLYAADAVIQPLHLTYPHWNFRSDFDYEQTQATRHDLIQQAADCNALVTAYHFPFPALGRLASGVWQPLQS